MSVTTTRQGRKYRGRSSDYSDKPRYQPFDGGELEGFELVKAHLAWLRANMDWFALQGKATLNTASIAMHRDLEMLGMLPRKPELAELAALFAPPTAKEVAEELARLHEKHGAVRAKLDQLSHLLHDWTNRQTLGDVAWRKAYSDSCYILLDVRRKLQDGVK
jgi:hypothetical protein